MAGGEQGSLRACVGQPHSSRLCPAEPPGASGTVLFATPPPEFGNKSEEASTGLAGQVVESLHVTWEEMGAQVGRATGSSSRSQAVGKGSGAQAVPCLPSLLCVSEPSSGLCWPLLLCLLSLSSASPTRDCPVHACVHLPSVALLHSPQSSRATRSGASLLGQVLVEGIPLLSPARACTPPTACCSLGSTLCEPSYPEGRCSACHGAAQAPCLQGPLLLKALGGRCCWTGAQGCGLCLISVRGQPAGGGACVF